MRLFSLLTASAMALLASCATTPQTRLTKDPTLLEGLSSEQARLAQSGRIEKGMTTRAVYLAWGRPDNLLTGERKNTRLERWDYTSLRPVVRTSFYGYRGHTYGAHRAWRHRSLGFGPEIDYLPTPTASVLFENGRVVEWISRR